MRGLNDLTDDQHRAIAFIQAGEDALVAADVGTGKTVISLTATYQDKRRWLVLAPLLVATDTWANEPSQWEHLKGVTLRVATGEAHERLAAINSDAQYVVMNYENLQWLCECFISRPNKNTFPFSGVIFDELDKLKDSSSKRFKEFRNRIGRFERRIGLTGTLVPNNLLEMWGQVYMVDAGASFGRSFYKWRKEHFYPTDFQQFNWAPFPSTRQRLIDGIKDLAIRIKAQGLPPVVFEKPKLLKLDPTTYAHYKVLEDEFFLQLKDKKGKDRVVDAANSAVLSGKLQQICAGFSYVDGLKEAVWHNTDRFEWYANLYRETRGGRNPPQLLVVYQFREELKMLQEMFPGIAYLGGGVTPTRAREAIRAWNAREIPQLAIHPASASHGLNLQKGGAHHIVLLTIPWSGGACKQVFGRLARRGQTAKSVHVHTAPFAGTIDEEVLVKARTRLADMESFLYDLGAATGA